MYMLMDEKLYERQGTLAVFGLRKKLETLEEAILERDSLRNEGYGNIQVFQLVKVADSKEVPDSQPSS
jgi:hypothetical protein